VGLVPLHEGPPQPANIEDPSEIAVSVVVVPREKVQSEVHEINPGEVVTLPLPEPPRNTETVLSGARLGDGLWSCARVACGTAIANPATTTRNFRSPIGNPRLV
jgi:hypothetical protein